MRGDDYIRMRLLKAIEEATFFGLPPAIEERIKVHLEKVEWGMGCGAPENEGQCPECCGLSREWLLRGGGSHPSCPRGYDDCGHKPNCLLARSLEQVGAGVQRVRPLRGV